MFRQALVLRRPGAAGTTVAALVAPLAWREASPARAPLTVGTAPENLSARGFLARIVMALDTPSQVLLGYGGGLDDGSRAQSGRRSPSPNAWLPSPFKTQ